MKFHTSFWLLLFAFPTLSSAADWNQWRGPNRDGAVVDSPQLINQLPEAGLKPLWISHEDIPSARSGGWASPIVWNDRVYIFAHIKTRLSEGQLPKRKYPYLSPDKRTGMSDEEFAEYEKNRRAEEFSIGKKYRFDEVVYCLDARSGDTLWKNERESVYTRFPQSGSPAVIDGKLYVLGAGRVARCMDAADGKDVWDSKLSGEFEDEFLQSSFSVSNGVACVLCGHLFGIDIKSGKVLWQGDPQDTAGTHTSPVVWQHQGKHYFVVNVDRNKTICVDSKSGKELWRIESESGHSTPIIVQDLLITYGNSRKKGLRAYKMSLTTAEHLWTFQGSGDSGSSPVVVGGYVYVQGEKRLACVALEDGSTVWQTSLDLANPRYASLIAADNKVFYAWEGLLCFEANPEEFIQLMGAKFNEAGLMAEESTHRKLLNIDQLEKSAEGQKKAVSLWRSQVDRQGPLTCTTPAIADGKLYLRMSNKIVCYDLVEH
ncbi:MAG: PQQ-binding-like beta-propeller repeat protein [Pirellulales bacterium]|jgi:outer membrane protein assembly factor BamB